MKAFACFFLSLFFYASLAFGQKLLSVQYYNKKGDLVLIRDSAFYSRMISEPDSGSKFFHVLEYYMNGNKRLIGLTSDYNRDILEGKCILYYTNGQEHLEALFNRGNETGLVTRYYPNGLLCTKVEYRYPHGNNYLDKEVLLITYNDSTGNSLVKEGQGYYKSQDPGGSFEEGKVTDGRKTGAWKGADKPMKVTFKEKYENGYLVWGIATDSTGLQHQYYQRNKFPGFNGEGLKRFTRYAEDNLSYPYSAIQNKVQGVVLVSFDINPDGTTYNFKVTKSVNPELDKEALRLVTEAKGWVPGSLYGMSSKGHLNVPVTFKLPE